MPKHIVLLLIRCPENWDIFLIQRSTEPSGRTCASALFSCGGLCLAGRGIKKGKIRIFAKQTGNDAQKTFISNPSPGVPDLAAAGVQPLGEAP